MEKKILLVDDEQDILKMTEFRLKKAGFKTITALNGTTGLEKVRKEKPDLVLLDFRLPDMTGLDVYNIMKADSECKDIPVIFLTASRGNEDIKEMLEKSGAEHVMIKPYEPVELISKVKSVIGD